jgi:2-aminoadipate transaminase
MEGTLLKGRAFSKAIGQVKTSAVRDILKLTQSSNVLSFAGGLPAEESFPVEPIREAYERVLGRGAGALQYGVTEGVLALREWLVGFLQHKRMEATTDRLLVTTGSQQGIDLVLRVMIDAGDRVLVERPTYLAALQAMTLAQAEAVEVESDAEGMQLEDLEGKLKAHRPKLVYVTPTFSNPGGKLWSSARREGLVELCRKYGALLVEDDPYGDIRFNETLEVTSLYELDAAFGGEANVLYLGSFSKTVAPAMRTGFAAGPESVIRMMAKAKQASDLHSSSIDQYALYELMTRWDWKGHQRRISAMYEERMRGLISLWTGPVWEKLHWNEPQGGMFLWVALPKPMVAAELLKLAVEEGVAFVPGEVFYAGEPERNTLRINFTHTSPDKVQEGTARLARAIERYPQ